MEKCYKLHGYPPGYKSKAKTNQINAVTNDNVTVDGHSSVNDDLSNMFRGFSPSQCQQVMSALTNHMISVNPNENTTTGKCYSLTITNDLKSCMWILDSGASQHVSHDINLFTNTRKVYNHTVTLPNKLTIPVNLVGDIKVDYLFTLKNVLYVPDFDLNLISVSALTKSQQMIVQFTCHHAYIQDTFHKRMIGKADNIQDLYVMRSKQEENFKVDDTRINVVSLDLWHKRLGHHSNKVLIPIKNILGVSITQNKCNDHCSICPLAKQKQLSFDSENNFCNEIFDMVHCDIWGPYQNSTYNGQRYFATIVDDKSRYTWIYLLKHKYDIIGIIPKFYSYVQTQFNKNIKCFRTDNAKELEFKEFFEEKGIIHQKACVAKPKQNSVVERKHQHLLNVARSLLFQSNIPIHFWGDCVLTAAYLINRIPSKILSYQSPFQIHGSIPKYKYL